MTELKQYPTSESLARLGVRFQISDNKTLSIAYNVGAPPPPGINTIFSLTTIIMSTSTLFYRIKQC